MERYPSTGPCFVENCDSPKPPTNLIACWFTCVIDKTMFNDTVSVHVCPKHEPTIELRRRIGQIEATKAMDLFEKYLIHLLRGFVAREVFEPMKRLLRGEIKE